MPVGIVHQKVITRLTASEIHGNCTEIRSFTKDKPRRKCNWLGSKQPPVQGSIANYRIQFFLSRVHCTVYGENPPVQLIQRSDLPTPFIDRPATIRSNTSSAAHTHRSGSFLINKNSILIIPALSPNPGTFSNGRSIIVPNLHHLPHLTVPKPATMSPQPAFCAATPMISSTTSTWLQPASAPISLRPTLQRSTRVQVHEVPRMVLLNDTKTASEIAPALPKRVPTKHDIATGRDPERVKIFDTTLRDGEQSPGATLTRDEKMIIARQLAKLGVDIIEAGFPIASDGDFEAVRDIAKTIGNREDPPIVCGLARALKKDISRCYDAVKEAAFPRIHIFIATSDVHMAHKLKKTREEVLQITTEMVSYGRSLCDDIEFSAEDAIRSDPDFLCEVFSRAIAAGATTLNVPDTVGYTTPSEFGSLIRYIRANVKGVDNVTISVHGHDDLGMAVANFLSAVENGARQMECTINGIGERAGNASLEEVVMALYVRQRFYNARLGRDADSDAPLTNISHKEIYQSSRMVSNLTGMIVQPNKAIVGSNAFAHESGIHQDGVLKHRQTYEIMDAQSIGLSENSLVLGKHSGRHAFRTRLTDMGYECNEEELNRTFKKFKDLADKKKEVSEADLESLINDEVRLVKEVIRLERVQVQCGNLCVSTATVTLNIVDKDETVTISSTGTGPVDAAFNAIDKVANDFVKVGLLEYMVNSVTKGIDALGDVTVRVIDGSNGRQYTGASANTDIVVASAQAYVNAINRCQLHGDGPEKIHPQFGTA